MPATIAPPKPQTLPQTPRQKPEFKPRLKMQPPYNVVLINDDDHSVDYVVHMMQKLFGKKIEDGLKIAEKVHREGRAICLTTTLEHAELKQEQIHAFGPDPLIPRCKGSMTCELEPAQ